MKRRSVTNASKEQPNPVFFTDRDLGKAAPAALKEAGLEVIPYHERFDSPTVPDTVWLKVVGDEGWVALSHNKKIRYDSAETRALMESGARVFMLIGARIPIDHAHNFVEVMPTVRRFLKRYDGPFIAKVYAGDQIKRPRVAMWLTHEQWKARPKGKRRRKRKG